MFSGALYFYVYFFLWVGKQRDSLPFPPLFLNEAARITFPTDKGNWDN